VSARNLYSPCLAAAAPAAQGITNTCGSLVGILGNVVTGYLASTSLGYQAVFAVTVVMHVVAFVLWQLGAQGEQLQLT
jgi:sugar phosphate permease